MSDGPHPAGSWLGPEVAQRRLSLWRASGGALAARVAGRRRPASVAGATRLRSAASTPNQIPRLFAAFTPLPLRSQRKATCPASFSTGHWLELK